MESAIQEVYQFLKKTGTYYLATTDGDRPRVRPFGTIDLYRGRLYIQTGLSKPVAKQMLANPHIEICAFDGTSWLRAEATATRDADVAAEEHMLAAYPELRGMYTPGDGNTAVFYLTDVCAVFCSFERPPKTVRF